jgi:predicted methyltransferase
VIALTVAFALAGCASTEPGGRASGLPEGINDTFLDETLDVEEYVERFEGESRDVYARRLEITEALALSPGGRVADIGAGTGFFSFLFAERVGTSGRVDAVEISPAFLKHLREQRTERGLEQLRVVEGSARSVELEPDSIDLAFICDVYHHFEYPSDTLASLHRAIRPGGSLVLIDFERIPGVSPEWLLEHVRAGREVFIAEVEAAGFRLDEEIEIEGLDENYVLRFSRPETAARP